MLNTCEKRNSTMQATLNYIIILLLLLLVTIEILYCYKIKTTTTIEKPALINCLQRISNKYFDNYTMIGYDSDFTDLVDEFLKHPNTKIPITLSLDLKYSDINFDQPNYILFSNSKSYTRAFLENTTKHFSSTSEKGDRFVIVSSNPNVLREIMVEHMLKKYVFLSVSNRLVLSYKVEVSWEWVCTGNFLPGSPISFTEDCDIDGTVCM